MAEGPKRPNSKVTSSLGRFDDVAQGGKRAHMEADDQASRVRDLKLESDYAVHLKGLQEPAVDFQPEPSVPNATTSEKQKIDLAHDELKAPVSASLERGLAVLRGQLKTMPFSPGVYRMLNAKGDPLYVGKAKSLKKRVTSYTLLNKLPIRLQRMVSETCDMEIVVTHTEVEALLLEANLIKRFMPRYNVLLRDDKSFPYILLRKDQDFPQIRKHRGAQKSDGYYFGPFVSGGAVNRTLTALEKAFRLRTCSDSDFETRTRPCLLYHIKRCSGPCTGKISQEDYGELVEEARQFLFGHSSKMQEQLAEKMQTEARNLNFEKAATYRDRIKALTEIQARQDVNYEGMVGDVDLIAAFQSGGDTCIQVFFFRGGRNYGNRPYFPSHDKKMDLAEVMSAFIAQFYQDKAPPKEILINTQASEQDLLAEALSVRAGHKVKILLPQRGPKHKILTSATRNAEEALKRRQAESATQARLLRGLAHVVGHAGEIKRVEVYDNSHLQGTNAFGCMIVAGPEGFDKKSYRKWSYKTESADAQVPSGGDDFAMMAQTLKRRFQRAIKESQDASDQADAAWPDLVLLDGGKGQLSAVQAIFDELGVTDVSLAAVAKGTDRDAGRETLFMTGRAPFKLAHNDPVLYFIQRLRDEAHRFAIGAHRAKRGKEMQKSLLDQVPGIGPKRKKALLLHFGSAKAVSRAGLEDLRAVEGVSQAMALQIYEHFHANVVT